MMQQCWLAKNADYPVEGSSCYSEGSCEKYGRLYNGDIASDVCPEGSHLPSSEEFNSLINTYGGVNAGNHLKAKGVWADHDDSNAKGFDALPAGYINDEGNPIMMDEKTYFWASDVVGMERFVYYFSTDNEIFQQDEMETDYQLSVRCIVDSGTWK